MRIIKQLACDIETNICEAEDKIETAYKMKTDHPNIAAWYKDMASAHLGFNVKGHELVAVEINNYRKSDEYARHPEYVDGMMAVWDDKHAELVTLCARVKAMIDNFK